MVTYEDLMCGKVKLEFGNREQIKVIRDKEKEIEEDKKRKDYEVTIDYSGSQVINVRALDEDEAKELAQDKFSIYESEYDIDRIEVEEVKPKKV